MRTHKQVAAENNTAGATYPDQSLYPVNSVPVLVKRINNVRWIALRCLGFGVGSGVPCQVYACQPL